MPWKDHYIPPEMTPLQGRPDTPPQSCFFQITQPLNLLESHAHDRSLTRFALLGFRCDEGIRRNLGRVGAAEGPPAIRQALARLPVQKPSFQCYDAGDIVCRDGDLEAAQTAFGDAIALLIEQGFKPIAPRRRT